ncbi:hypothetical protein GFK26_03845 [Variovorax paradoxus]|jgi:hydrogenase maturation factor HypF (carbamoyltransferase family)|uniref:Cobalt-zinc-cadmium resistance protein n=1 Tax=Variovorax paradoxus TaxID=34073 RepID=A0A5Q0LWZ3_VARPD|nr:hypothetical protein GFK26_03845 [Variovorax paradoxus]
MSCFRVLLLWALTLAVPFQGYAAASMAFCETEQAEAAETVHVGSHHHSHAAASDADHLQGTDDESAGHPDGSGVAHKCGTCGACHAVALVADTSVVRTEHLPAADLAEPHVRPTTLFPLLLERPPRA